MNKNMLTINPKKTQYIDFGWEQKKLKKLNFKKHEGDSYVSSLQHFAEKMFDSCTLML